MIRKTAHAGSFYPRFGEQISPQIEVWTAGRPTAMADEACLGLIVPHAGYMYSGQCAALGYHYISEQEIDSFVILHPSHQGSHFDYSVSAFTEYDTPFGRLELDSQLFGLLTANNRSHYPETRLHELEHSLEIQLPLIKYYFPEARICPVMIGRPYPEVAAQLGKKLNEAVSAVDRRVAVIVSTDLSHYYNADKAEKMDALIQKYIMGFDPDGLWQSVVTRRCEACGIGGLLALFTYLEAWPQARAKIIQYTHSGKATGDNQQVVGYLSALIYE